jgi:hypothetical protein
MRIQLSLITLFIALACGTSNAQNCVSYFDPPPKHCIGSGGCDTFVPTTSCIIGCISGTCNPNGNVASCCGVASFYAQIFTDGGTCSGQNCGLSRINRAKKMRANFETLNAHFSPPLPGRMPLRRIFTLNTCTKDYAVVYEWDGLRPAVKGM